MWSIVKAPVASPTLPSTIPPFAELANETERAIKESIS